MVKRQANEEPVEDRVALAVANVLFFMLIARRFLVDLPEVSAIALVWRNEVVWLSCGAMVMNAIQADEFNRFLFLAS